MPSAASDNDKWPFEPLQPDERPSEKPEPRKDK